MEGITNSVITILVDGNGLTDNGTDTDETGGGGNWR
jgi:hypothetical protein